MCVFVYLCEKERERDPAVFFIIASSIRCTKVPRDPCCWEKAICLFQHCLLSPNSMTGYAQLMLRQKPSNSERNVTEGHV